MSAERVLVADDSALIRAVVRTQLEQHGYEVSEADDGRAALERMTVERPDVVILDIEMPGMDGYSVLGALRRDRRFAHVPVIFLSGRTKLEDVIAGLESGAHDYLSKPFEPGELLARVRAAARVKQLADERQQRNGELERLAAQLEQRNRSLEEANTALAAANQLKLDLMGMLSHEIGRPLTLIQGHAELLLDESPETSTQHESLSTITRNVSALARMRTEILAMCAVDTASLVAERSPVRVVGAIEDALSVAGCTAAITGDHGVTVLVNPSHLQHMLVNYLTNAAKYGGGAVSVDAVVTVEGVEVRVVDEGPGVPEDLRDRLFERFTRGSDEMSRRHGIGLGLYIVRSLAVANGGSAHHEPAPGGGSVFVLRLQPAQVRTV